MKQILDRIMSLIGTGAINVVNDTGPIQTMQVSIGSQETIDQLKRLGEYGFVSSPPEGSGAVVVFIGGHRSNGAVIATGNPTYRPTGLQPGDAGIHDNRQQSIILTAEGIVINCNNLPITINGCPTLTLNGNLQVNGTVISTGDIKANEISLENHTHSGVEAGSGYTGAPQG